MFGLDWRSCVLCLDPAPVHIAEGWTSCRERAEVTSARKTRMHGVVVVSQKAHQLKVLQRVPMEDGCECGPNQLCW